MGEVQEQQGADELTPEEQKTLDMQHVLALIHSFNEMAIKATTLGEKAWYRSARDASEKQFNALGGTINRTAEHAPIFEIPGHVPEIRFDERDIELMRECVARHDATTPGTWVIRYDDPETDDGDHEESLWYAARGHWVGDWRGAEEFDSLKEARRVRDEAGAMDGYIPKVCRRVPKKSATEAAPSVPTGSEPK